MDYRAQAKVKQDVPEEIVREKGKCLWTHGPAADPQWAQRKATRMRDTFMLQAAEPGFAPHFPPFVYRHNGAEVTAQLRASTTQFCDDRKAQNVNNHGGSQAHSDFTRDCDMYAIKISRFSGKTDWNAFKAQFELSADAAGLSENHKALQLELSLTDDAAA